ncbi:heavy-metal-associated domain-containing protein [Larkinella rosea]|uniref:Heavy-metal-associated domain-containing protein n=1 Tax=Larkinella rosea TaxID=2025312 RepID=A0A3P1BP87_9BACT|nr:heavy metal-associated domain-containing protein [Larkinella rosea]RRB02723.1 heavy-metal-associated domain-containing protein [Larkinella rosea]
MKKHLFGLITILFLALGLPAKAGDDNEKEVKIKTSAICEMCKERIERNLAFEKGIKESNLDLKDKVVTVRYNPKKTDVNKIKATISKTGYDADEVMADEKGYAKLPSCCKKSGHK